MANYFKARLIIKKVENHEEDFDNLWSVLENEDSEEFCECIEADSDRCQFVDEPPELCDDCILMSLLFRYSELSPRFVSEFAEYFHDNFCVDMDMVYCDEYENTESVGLFRKEHKKIFFDGQNHDDDGQEYEEWEDYEYSAKDHFYRPKDEKQRHEAFLMSWDGYRCIHNTEPYFFNQLGLDDEYFKVKEFEDDSGILPSLFDWLPKAYTTFEEFEPKFF